MDNNIKNIFKNVMNYLDLKKECIEKQYENLYDVVDLFASEVIELKNVAIDLCSFIDAEERQTNLTENQISLEIINTYEEHLVNEIADVLLTGSRLIQEFGLEEALSEMIEYKYERQVGRELKRIKKC